MRIAEEFDGWATDGRDRSMEERHWHTAKHAIEALPVEDGDTVLDLGTGSGYALRAIANETAIDRGVGLDASAVMLRNAASYSDDGRLSFVQGTFESIPLQHNSIDHAFSMEAFYYASDPHQALRELRRIIVDGGTFHCAVNFFDESEQTHRWQDELPVEMTLWDRQQYRDAFENAGFAVASQRCIPDAETEIPPADAFPTDGWDRREDMVDRYRRWGTLVTVGVACQPPQ